jgi:hypothetical protein
MPQGPLNRGPEIIIMNIKPGDIVLAEFPMHDGKILLHPALVLEVMESLSGMIILRCAYGSSKKTESVLPDEFVIRKLDGRAFEVSGLRQTTRFNLNITARFCASSVRRVGLLHPSLYGRFRSAAQHMRD